MEMRGLAPFPATAQTRRPCRLPPPLCQSPRGREDRRGSRGRHLRPRRPDRSRCSPPQSSPLRAQRCTTDTSLGRPPARAASTTSSSPFGHAMDLRRKGRSSVSASGHTSRRSDCGHALQWAASSHTSYTRHRSSCLHGSRRKSSEKTSADSTATLLRGPPDRRAPSRGSRPCRWRPTPTSQRRPLRRNPTYSHVAVSAEVSTASA
mmetsp:Transcript_132595/g.383297  ORF Transcript_132595/g.383297 Transcript_132595/m.383297 type:complete len:206 (-) Transcript_132595:53-670(-)